MYWLLILALGRFLTMQMVRNIAVQKCSFEAMDMDGNGTLTVQELETGI